ncbi:hypothetical protein WMW71_08590 [Flavobacterium buctense]|uniref:Uncharacterized protein n=1 Tax=Flavobacterium buctense TaxID=1648146 RepID=A0ABU9E171_9FLAO|nr:hypothetical protein [Flavobacterium buctense]
MMKKKPYFLFLFASLLLLLIGFVKSEETFDINVHDTYFIILQNHLYWLFTLLLFFFFIIYLTLDKIRLHLLKMLTKIHIYGTLLLTVGIFFPYDLLFTSSNFLLVDDSQSTNVYRSFCVLFFLIAQVLFIINIFVAIIKKLRN